MGIEVRLFAAAREAAGCERIDLELAPGARVRDAEARLIEAVPALKSVLARSRFAINRIVVHGDEELRAGDELAVLPPVGGG